MTVSQGLIPDRFRTLHLVVGTIALVVFLATGQYMHWWQGHLRGMENGPRLLFRSAHIYLLWSGLLNTVLGVYFQASGVRWCRMLQRVGSVAILMGPPLLVASFLAEPWLVGLVRPYARPAIYVAFAGVLAHLLAAVGDRIPNAKQKTVN